MLRGRCLFPSAWSSSWFLFFCATGAPRWFPAVAVPVSLMGTFAVMYLFGYSLDNLSLMAMTISTGFVVDDAIVVMENIARHLENGMEPVCRGAERRGGNRIHRLHHQHFAHCGIHSPIDDGRNCRPAVSGVCRHSLDRHCGFHDHLADYDADDVRLSLAQRAQRKAWPPLHGQRKFL